MTSTAFIIYPHNPDPYLKKPSIEEMQQCYPEKTESEIWQMMIQDDDEEKKKINGHDELVDRFSTFLLANGVKVVHEGQVRDKSVSNLMRWFQDQLKVCDYIILIITKSFSHFLSNPKSLPDDGKEPFFEGEFLHILIHKSKKPLLPVFLGGDSKDLSLLPDALRSSSTFHVRSTSPFCLDESEMDNLYAILTNQNRYSPIPIGRPVRIKKKSGFGCVSHQISSLGQAKYRDLKSCSQELSTRDLRIAENDTFAKQWKKLSKHLDIPCRVMERIAGDEPNDVNEQCSMMLSHWMNNYSSPTVTRLAEAIWKCQDEALLEIAHKHFI